jgi:uncharacterized protein YqeY
MLTKEIFEKDLHTSMREGDDVRKRTLRMLISAIQLREVDKRDKLDEAEITSLLQKEVKSREETIEEAEKAGRTDLVESTKDEIQVLLAYLPEPLSHAELEQLIRQSIDEVGATSPDDMGNVMKAVMPKVQGRADGKQVSSLVRELLSSS